MLGRLVLALVAVWVARVTGDCGRPPRIENGDLSEEYRGRDSFPIGARVTYDCYVGYVFASGFTRSSSCQADSTWAPLRGRCEPMNCGNPGEILNGYYNADATTLGNKAIFHCDEGYRIVGTNYRMCTANGWSGQVPTCEAITCSDLAPIRNGKAPVPPGDSWTYGMVAEYSCDDDYSLIGAAALTCQVDGTWDKEPPDCRVVECHRPDTPANGYIERGFGRKYKYQDEIVFRCNEGFEMIGASVIKCSENNSFVPSPPICRLPPTSKPKPKPKPTTTIAALTTVPTKSWANVTIKPTDETPTLSTGAIVGISIVVVVAGVVIIVVIVKRWSKKKEGQYTTPEKVVHEVQLR
ncbi:membrane cofactor protein-like isoform X2 [Hemiscyllium ocellatum]|uniref:membrane cofactor protein-like isoform X2 n=1 Tax=Hemiscyllium ocellatum TaxID=170820 RepID=UPI0029676926|nr:membrane cofactor protein-like isoform X2 [Hemiscyllium ocellatum]